MPATRPPMIDTRSDPPTAAGGIVVNLTDGSSLSTSRLHPVAGIQLSASNAAERMRKTTRMGDRRIPRSSDRFVNGFGKTSITRSRDARAYVARICFPAAAGRQGEPHHERARRGFHAIATVAPSFLTAIAAAGLLHCAEQLPVA